MGRVCRWEAVRIRGTPTAALVAIDVAGGDVLAHGYHSSASIEGIAEAIALRLLGIDTAKVNYRTRALALRLDRAFEKVGGRY